MSDAAYDYDKFMSELKAEFPRHKTYNLKRWLLRDAVHKLVDMHGLEMDKDMSGSVQCTPSIGYSWNVYRHGDNAVAFYADNGMGWDMVMLLSKSKAGLEELRQTGIKLGVVKLRAKKSG